MTSTPETTYHGYTNLETFGVAVIIDNDEALLYTCQGTVARYTDMAEAGADLEGFIEEYLAEEDHCPMAAQLISAAMGRVNWTEIAEHYRRS